MSNQSRKKQMPRSLFLFSTWCGCFGGIGFPVFFLTAVVSSWPGVELSPWISNVGIWIASLLVSAAIGSLFWWWLFGKGNKSGGV
jgi:hypothetical protein